MREISKKNLLTETGISYGQLYRWKREGLIPEEWFIKRSAYTGQETYFPREQALSRIRAILEMKDSCSLEEIRETLDTSDGPRFTREALAVMTNMADESLARLSAAKEASLTLDGWALVAGVYEAGVEMELASDELLALTDEAVAWVKATDAAAQATREAQAPHEVQDADTLPEEAVQAGAVTSSASHSPPSQVSVVSAGGAYHFITSTAPTELQGNATLVVHATRPLQVYRNRAQAALLSKAQSSTAPCPTSPPRRQMALRRL
ncbi:MAG: YhbD family protein [Coriobacteriales bacterium]|jgi:DNA-binding transcriptional MerR regulator|nr:YhbD family protein [Coriobacteriales bacterium]